MQADSLLIQSFNVQRVYDDYFLNDKYLVNRKYQRKLVWSIEEKQAFVDSISKKYPVPLFLVASKNANYEIIDGMQRLNSIFSFIEGEFGIIINGKEHYFDLETMPTTSDFIKNNKIQQNLPKLNYTICRDIANYELPFSVANFEDDLKIEEIFRRINSNGRHLSEHELRQAGALGKFSDLVRQLSAEVRRDSSPNDLLKLSRMKEISLSNRRLPYGISL